MSRWSLVWANLTRRKARFIFTLLSVIFAFTLFGVLIALRQAFTAGVRFSGVQRLMTLSAVSLVNQLPLSYGRSIAALQGVRAVTPEAWMGGYFRDPRHPIFALAVQARAFFAVYPEDRLPQAERRAWLSDKRGVIIGPVLARQYGWRIGQQIPLRSGIWLDHDDNNTWNVILDGILTTALPSDDNLMLMHYKYLDDARSFANGTTSFFALRIADPRQAGRIARTVDALFANSPHQTRTATEQSFLRNFASEFGDVGAIVAAVVSAVFFTMLLVTGNTMAQSVRERTAELGLMKALGFTDVHLCGLALLESLAITVTGGLLGLSLSYGLIAGFGYFAAALLEFLPGMRIPAAAALLGVLLTLLLGALAALLPVTHVMRLRVAEALRES